MTLNQITILWIMTTTFSAHAYEGPSPLNGIIVKTSAMFDSATGLYSYNYGFTNPSTNDGGITAIRISIERDPQLDMAISSNGLNHCAHHSKRAEQANLSKTPMVPVGSATPAGWSCNYHPDGTFSFGAIDDPDLIKPGTSRDGYILKSVGLPGIRNIVVEPAIDYQAFPPDWEGDSSRLQALREKVNFTAKTIGPKAPPKIFVPSHFIDYLISIKEQASSLGWIKNQDIVTSLDAKLNNAKKKIASGDKKTAKNVLSAFQNEVQAQNGKQLTPEAYALLYFNAKYLIDHL
jgi:hypothetical protein